MLLACAVGLRSFTQTGAKSFLLMWMERSPLPNFAVLSPSGFVCTFLPLLQAGARRDSLYQQGSGADCCPTSHSKQFYGLISSFCPSDPPASISCWEPKTPMNKTQGALSAGKHQCNIYRASLSCIICKKMLWGPQKTKKRHLL